MKKDEIYRHSIVLLLLLAIVIMMVSLAVFGNVESADNQLAVHLSMGLGAGFIALFAAMYLWIRKRYGDIYVENQRFHAIMSVSQSLVFEHYEKNHAIKWYGDAQKAFEEHKEGILLKEIMHPEDYGRFRKQMQELRDGNEYEAELRLKGRNGEYLWCNCRLVAVRTISGKIISIIGIIRNIDDQKKKELALMSEKELLSEAIKMLGDTYFKIIMIDLETGKIKYVKADEGRLMKEDDYDYWHMETVEKFVHPDFREGFFQVFSLETLRKVMNTEHPRQTLVYRRRDPGDSKYRWAQAEYILCENRQEVMVYVKDVTDERIAQEKHRQELEKALEKAREASHIKTEFLEYVSHDLRTPMNAVNGMNQLAMRAIDEGDTAKAKEYMERVHSSAEYLMTLIADILDMSHFQRDELVLDSRAFLWESVVEECRDYFEYIIKDRSVSFEIENHVCGKFVGDFMRLRQILFNLIENAVKFNKPDGKVLLKITSKSINADMEQIHIVLADTGIGMSRQQLERLFEPFSRGKRIASEVNSGTGIGLAIVKHIADAMKGEIHVDSTLNIGTTVELWLPLQKVDEQDAMLSENNKAAEEMTVLVVDDIEINREIAATLLEDEGYSILMAENGREALELFEKSAEGSIDVVLTDISMPEMDGYSLAKAIRSLERSDADSTYIIALSAYGYGESKDQVEQSGMNAFINKPFDVERFNEIVNR